MSNYNISVIIPAYNRANLLPRTIKSVSEQTFKPYEVIIIDDESPDDTQKVCEELIDLYKNDLSIKYIRHEKNKGEGGARNTGIKSATGNYYAFLDSDDEWIPAKLERQVEFLKLSNADGVFCESYLVENGDYKAAQPIYIDHDLIIAENLLTKGCGYGVGTNLMISANAVNQQLFDETMRLFIDIDWLYRVSQGSSIKVLHETLSYYHKAPMRAGSYVEEKAQEFLQKYHAHLKTWPLHKRLEVYSCMNWYIAHSYKGNNHYFRASKYFLKGALQKPFRHPGHYIEILNCLIKGAVLKAQIR